MQPAVSSLRQLRCKRSISHAWRKWNWSPHEGLFVKTMLLMTCPPVFYKDKSFNILHQAVKCLFSDHEGGLRRGAFHPPDPAPDRAAIQAGGESRSECLSVPKEILPSRAWVRTLLFLFSSTLYKLLNHLQRLRTLFLWLFNLSVNITLSSDPAMNKPWWPLRRKQNVDLTSDATERFCLVWS